jgi:predicted ester cyclase
MQDGKVLVTRYLEEIVTRGRFQVADEVLADVGFVDSLRALRTAFPDWTVSVKTMIAEGDFVSDLLSVHAMHTGQAGGKVPTGETLVGELMHLWRLSNGRLAEGWYFGTPALMSKVFAALSPS